MKKRHSFLVFTLQSMCCLLTFLIVCPWAYAYDSFTLDVSFYQGVDLSDGMTELDPTVLTLLFGDSGQIEVVLEPELENPFDFSAAVDFHFEYDVTTGLPTMLISDYIVGMAVLEDTQFNLVTSADLEGLDFDSELSAVSLNSMDTVFLLTQEDTYIKIGNIQQLSDSYLSFEYQQVASNAVPEPSTLILLGIGLLGIVSIGKRAHRKRVTML